MHGFYQALFHGKKTTPTQSSCFFIHSSWAEVQSCTAFATTILCFMKPWPFGWRKGRAAERLRSGEIIGVSLPELPMWRSYCPLDMILLSHEWCFLRRKAWVNQTQQHLENVTSLFFDLWSVTNFVVPPDALTLRGNESPPKSILFK